jgi:hypothetical protein
MTMFDKTKFVTSGEYVHYEGKFVARFKHKGPLTKAKLLKALMKFYTPETYFPRLAKEAPYGILMNDGHVVFDLQNRKFIFNY